MSRKIAFIFPGQGAQYPGMGADFYENFSEARAVFEAADALLERPFSKLILEGPAEELTLTKNSQLAIYITSIALLKAVEAHLPDLVPSLCAGLSLGEYTALVASGKLTFEEGLRLVEARGLLMDEACHTHPGTMRVALGLEPSVVEEVIAPIDQVWIANLNCPGQVVISGAETAVEEASLKLKEKGAKRVLPLEVSGAFHSGLMASAQEGLAPLIDDVTLSNGWADLVMNVSGSLEKDPDQMRQNMINQVTHPVLWQKGVEEMVRCGVDLFVEIGPGKTLAGMNKRIRVEQPTLSIEKIEDLKGVLEDATTS